MSADSLRAFGRGRGITKHRVGVPGGLGVVCEPGDVDRAAGRPAERAESSAVELELSLRCD